MRTWSKPTRFVTCLLAGVVALGAAMARPAPGNEAGGRNLVGTIDIKQGTATQLAGRPGEGPKPVAYEWVIVEGREGQLVHADQRDAIFVAPSIEGEVERFIVEVTVQFEDQRTARAQVEIRVHRDEPDDTGWLDDFYSKAEKSKQDRQAQNQSLNDALILSAGTGYYSRWNVGFGFGWGGGFVNYHAAIPIYFP
jgi:hypothetical protein